MRREKSKSPRVEIPSSLYKYLSVESALAVLESQTLQWSSPLEFNDPFDNQWNITWEAQACFESHIVPAARKMYTGELDWSSMAPGPKEEWSKARLEISLLPPAERTKRIEQEIDVYRRAYVNVAANKYRQLIEPDLARARALCLSETPVSLLMWSHYASMHKGAVFDFEPIAVAGAAAIHQVKYSKSLPNLVTPDEWVRRIMLNENIPALDNVADITIRTKAEQWSHECEWRLLYRVLRGIHARKELRPWRREALRRVIVGCRAEPGFVEKVQALVKARYAGVPVLRAAMSPVSFELVLESLG